MKDNVTMTLWEYIHNHTDEGSETFVRDSVYDTCTYFYNDVPDPDSMWDMSIDELMKQFNVVENPTQNDVICNISEVLEKHIKQFKKKDLFINYDIDDIMDSWDNAVSGYVSDKWMQKFVECLKN